MSELDIAQQPEAEEDLASSTPWQEIDVSTWEAFEEQIKQLRDRPSAPGPSPSALLFRGQEDSRWQLATTLERSRREGMLFEDYYRLITRVRPQIESFTGTEWAVPDYQEVAQWTREYDEFSLRLSSGRCPAYTYMVHLRHHGFPSPLLDWTRSPPIAAYFAFSKAACEHGGKVSIYVFSEAAFRARGNNLPLIFSLGPYVRTHRRHFLQQSVYTMCISFGTEWRFEQYRTVFDSNRQQQGTLWKFNIPASERTKV